jgi:hypothetical protein
VLNTRHAMSTPYVIFMMQKVSMNKIILS